MFRVLRPILNKGGAGRYATRAETVERLNPLVRWHHVLLDTYNNVLTHVDGDNVRAQIDALMPRARTESGKLSEAVFSAGGTPPNGVGLKPDVIGPEENDTVLLNRVLELERDYCEAVADEVDAIHHQERTRAILNVLREGSEARQETLRGIINRIPQPIR